MDLSDPHVLSREQLEKLQPLWAQALSAFGLSCPDTLDQDFYSRWVKSLQSLPLRSQVALHWRLERVLITPLSDTDLSIQQVRSLTLGIAQQVLISRLPKHSPEEMAAWLARSDQAPRKIRSTLKKLLKAQKERDSLRWAWKDFAPPLASPEPPRAQG